MDSGSKIPLCGQGYFHRRAYLQYPHFRIGLFAQSSNLGNTENLPIFKAGMKAYLLVVGIPDEEKGRCKNK